METPIIPYSVRAVPNRFTNPVLVWAELVLLGSGRVHNYTVLLAPVQSPQIVPRKNWTVKAGTSELDQWAPVRCQPMSHILASTFLARYGLTRIPRVLARLCSSYSPPLSVRTTFNPTRSRSRAGIVTWPNLSVPVNDEIVWKCRIRLFGRRTICSWMREAVLKLTMDYKMTKHMPNNGSLNESRTWLLVRTWHCYFISFNNEHPVRYFCIFFFFTHMKIFIFQHFQNKVAEIRREN